MASGRCLFRLWSCKVCILGCVFMLVPAAVDCGSIMFSVSDVYVELQGEGVVNVGRFDEDISEMDDDYDTWNDFHSDPNLVNLAMKEMYFADANGEWLDGYFFTREKSGNFEIHQEDISTARGFTTLGSHMSLAPFAARQLCDLKLFVDVVKRPANVTLDGGIVQTVEKGDVIMQLVLANISNVCDSCRGATDLKVTMWFTGSAKPRTTRASTDNSLDRTSLGGKASVLMPKKIKVDGELHTLSRYDLDVTSQNASAVMSLMVPIFHKSATYTWILKVAPLEQYEEGHDNALQDAGSEQRTHAHDDAGNGCDVTGLNIRYIVFAFLIALFLLQ